MENVWFDGYIRFLMNMIKKLEFHKAVYYTPLFILKINSIVRAISPDIERFLYIDDFVICYKSCNMNST